MRPQRHILILFDARFSPQILTPRGVGIGSEKGSELEAI
jgi:hypothetical protein